MYMQPEADVYNKIEFATQILKQIGSASLHCTLKVGFDQQPA